MQHRADFELAQGSAQVDLASFGALFDAWFDRVYAFVEHRVPTREAAEGATERILARAFAELARYDGSTPFSAWLLAIVKRELRASDRTSRAGLADGASLTGSGV